MTMVAMQLPATGRAVSMEQIHVARVAGGKIVEHWGLVDTLAIVRQLGLKISPAA
jgi:predicted ester cyclase